MKMGYRELAAQLRQRIDAGEFPVGSTLPRIVDLMEEYSLAKQTVRDAVGLLIDEGLVVTSKRAGTIVRDRTPQENRTDLLEKISRVQDEHTEALAAHGAMLAEILSLLRGGTGADAACGCRRAEPR